MKTRKGYNLVFVESVLQRKTVTLVWKAIHIPYLHTATGNGFRFSNARFNTLAWRSCVRDFPEGKLLHQWVRRAGSYRIVADTSICHQCFFNRQMTNRLATTDKVGFEPTGACAHSGFQDRAVMTTSVPIHKEYFTSNTHAP